MKFNYEFEFDVEEFADYIEGDFFDYLVGRKEPFKEEQRNKKWITDKLYDWYSDTSCPSILIISQDIEDNTKKYYPQIVEEAYEILKRKYNEYKEMKEAEMIEELKPHLKAIKEYCKNRATCNGCPLDNFCNLSFDCWEF